MTTEMNILAALILAGVVAFFALIVPKAEHAMDELFSAGWSIDLSAKAPDAKFIDVHNNVVNR